MPCNVVEHLGHFDGIVPSLACILTKQHGVRSEKYLLKTPGNTISETLNFKISLDASALKNLCLWCEFQNCLLFINSLPLKKFLTALRNPCAVDENYHIIFNIATFQQCCLIQGTNYMAGWIYRTDKMAEDITIICFLFVFKQLRMDQIDFLHGSNRLCWWIETTSVCIESTWIEMTLDWNDQTPLKEECPIINAVPFFLLIFITVFQYLPTFLTVNKLRCWVDSSVPLILVSLPNSPILNATVTIHNCCWGIFETMLSLHLKFAKYCKDCSNE